MKKLGKALVMAVAMYSKVPTPYMEWTDDALQYMFCFFPIVGVLIGGAQLVWFMLANSMELGTFFYGAIMAVIPIIITGGIHLDGYMDTMDAKNSYQSKERRLEILKDPHLGAFAVITVLVYMLLYVGGATEIVSMKACLMVSIGFVVSRAYSSIALVWFEPAKKDGTLYQFASTANKKAVTVVQVVVCLVGHGMLIALQPIIGIGILLGGMATMYYYHKMAKKQFGGITGDVAGYFLQLFELMVLLLVVFGMKLVEL